MLRQLEFNETKALKPPDKRCKRCGRKLKTAEALKIGYGKRCHELIEQQKAFRKEIEDED